MSGLPSPTTAPRALPRWLDDVSLLALFGVLLGATWMRWPDALVDFWRNPYLAWRLSEGALLYVDAADWYGPLPTLAGAAVFSIFGPGLDALVALNCVVALGCLFTLHRVLLRVGDRLSGWVGAASFLLIFCFGQYTPLGNYNFITPYVSQATWGFLGVVMTLEGALSNTNEDSRRGWLVAGAGFAIAWLSKAECLLAAAVILVALVAVRRRLPPARLFAGFAAIFVPVWLMFTAEGGLGYGLRATHQVLLFTVSAPVRATVAAIPIFDSFLGFDAPLANLLSHLEWGALTIAVLVLFAVAPRRWPLPAMTLCGAISAALVAFTPWRHLGRALLLPVVAGAALCGVAVLRGRRQWAPLFLLSSAALAMLARMVLNVRIIQYGFTMAVLATMTTVHLLIFEAPRLRLTSGERPPRALRLIAVALVLAASVRLTVESLQTYAVKSVPVGSGRDAFLSFIPAHQRNPALVNEMVAAVEMYTPTAKTLVVFPDSAAVSYLTRRPSPIPEFEFNPTSLGFSGGPTAVLDRLKQHPPDVVLLCSYELRSHGTPFFGATDSSGREIAQWVGLHYRKVAAGGPGTQSLTGHSWDLFSLRVGEP